MNLGHNVKYQNVLQKFDDGLCLTMPSGVIALCSFVDYVIINRFLVAAPSACVSA